MAQAAPVGKATKIGAGHVRRASFSLQSRSGFYSQLTRDVSRSLADGNGSGNSLYSSDTLQQQPFSRR